MVMFMVRFRVRVMQRVRVFFFQAEDGIRDIGVTGVQTCALPISAMSIKLGIGLAAWAFPEPDPEVFFRYLERAEAAGVDSLWLSERLTSPAVMLEPMTALAMAAARTRAMKFGMSVMVLPARNPVLLARAIATVDFLSGGRMLPAFGLGLEDPREQEAAGVPRTERAARVDEATRLLRRLWSE